MFNNYLNNLRNGRLVFNEIKKNLKWFNIHQFDFSKSITFFQRNLKSSR